MSPRGVYKRGKKRERASAPQPAAAGMGKKPPTGGREVTSSFDSQFFTFSEEGQTLEGVLAGTTKIKGKNQTEAKDRYVIVTGDHKTLILPDHVDLARKLGDVIEKSGFAARVWIEFLGKKKVENVAQPMAQYRVVDYGPEKK